MNITAYLIVANCGFPKLSCYNFNVMNIARVKLRIFLACREEFFVKREVSDACILGGCRAKAPIRCLQDVIPIPIFFFWITLSNLRGSWL